MKKIIKWYAPKAFNDGLNQCNLLGKKLICRKDIQKFLDVGCSDGKLTLEFAAVCRPREIYGIEFVDELREVAKSKGIQCLKADLNQKWDFKDDYFDFILSSQIIEHLHNQRLCLEESYRCLKKGGQMIVLTENLSSWVNIGALLFGWQPFSATCINGWNFGNPFIWHSDEPKDTQFLKKYQDSGVSGTVGHTRVLTYKGLKDFLAKTGFRNIEVYSTGYLPFWGMLSEILCWIDRIHGHFLVASAIK